MHRLLGSWALSLEAWGRSPATIRAYTGAVARCAALGGVEPQHLQPAHVTAWLATPGYSPDTRATYYRSMRAWVRWLEEQGHPAPMLRGVRKPLTPPAAPRPVTTLELRRVLADPLLSRQERGLVVLCAWAGLRIHEAVRVRGDDVDIYEATLRLVGKGGVRQVLELHPMVLDLARVMPPVGWWFPAPRSAGRPRSADGAGQVVVRVLARNGVDGGAHRLRHWHATELIRAGAPLPVVSGLMRHRSVASTLRYVAVGESQRRAALVGLPAAA